MRHILLMVGSTVYSSCGTHESLLEGHLLPPDGLLQAARVDCLGCLSEYHHWDAELERELCLTCPCCHRIFPVRQLSRGVQCLCDECNALYQENSRRRAQALQPSPAARYDPAMFDMLLEVAFPPESEP